MIDECPDEINLFIISYCTNQRHPSTSLNAENDNLDHRAGMNEDCPPMQIMEISVVESSFVSNVLLKEFGERLV